MKTKSWNVILVAAIGAGIGAGYSVFNAISGYGDSLTVSEGFGAAAGGAAAGALLGAVVAVIRNKTAT